jgi:hypothetical protein
MFIGIEKADDKFGIWWLNVVGIWCRSGLMASEPIGNVINLYVQ